MGVAQPRARRQAAWLAGVALVGVLCALELVLRVASAVAAASVGALEALRQRAEKWRTDASVSVAARARVAGRWRAMFEVAPLAMAKVSTDGRLEAVNAALCSLLGEPERVLAGRRLSALVYPDDRSVLAGAGHPGRSGRGPASAEVRLVCTGGRLRWCELTSHLVRDLDGSPEYVLTSVVDITRHKRSEAALRDLATRDPLTGMANRRWFELDLARHLRSCATSGSRGALLVVDIDRFKNVNDTLGHQVGDRLVMEVATTMRRHLRDQDLVARLGGDEFAVVLHEGDAGAAEAVARKLVRAVRDEVRTVGGEVDGPPRMPGPGVPGPGVPGPGAPDGTGRPGRAKERDPTVAGGAKGSHSLSARPRIRPIPRSGDRAVDLTAEPPAVVTVSVGVAPFQHFVVPGTPCPSGPELLRVADDAMYLVKRAGRDGYALAGNGAPQVHSRGRGRPGAVDVDLRGAAGGSRR